MMAVCVAAVAMTGADMQSVRASPRVVSANLCADELVLALGDPEQIVALGPHAGDPLMSTLASQAQRFVATGGSAEALLARKADLFLLGAYDSRHARAVLERAGRRTLVLEPWRDLAQGMAQIRMVAQALDQAARGEALVGAIEDKLRALDALAASRARTPTFLMVQRRGHVAVSGVVLQLLERAGLRNAAGELGLVADGFAPLERIVLARPDLIVVAKAVAAKTLDAHATGAPDDQGEAMLTHPALARLYPPAQRIVLSDTLTDCAGPATPALIDAIAKNVAPALR